MARGLIPNPVTVALQNAYSKLSIDDKIVWLNVEKDALREYAGVQVESGERSSSDAFPNERETALLKELDWEILQLEDEKRGEQVTGEELDARDRAATAAVDEAGVLLAMESALAGSGGSSGDAPSTPSDGSGSGSSPEGGGGTEGGGVEAMPGDDVVTGGPRTRFANNPNRAIILQQAVQRRLGGVIDGAESPAQGSDFKPTTAGAADDIVGTLRPHLPGSSSRDLPGAPGDPRLGGATDPAENDGDPRHRP